MKPIRIGQRRVGPGEPVYIVAELSANHHHDLDRAIALVRAAKEAGADAVKLQTYTADTMTIPCDNEYFEIGAGTLWAGRKLHDLYAEAYTPWEWHPKLQDVAHALGLDLFSTPFDKTAVAFLVELGIDVFKIASFENADLPLLRCVAETGKPVILSTGMATLEELDESVAVLRTAGCGEIVLLKCTSAYPAPAEEMNLRTIPEMSGHFDLPVGLSDHSMGHDVAVAAVALGACVVEKHFTLDRRDPGPDSAFSMEPAEFKAMVEAIRTTEKALGSACYGTTAAEKASRAFRRSLFVIKDVAAGEAFTEDNVRAIRPGHGLHTRHLEQILRRTAARKIPRGTPLSWDLVRK